MINISAEFFRVANKHVSSMKPPLKWANDILEEQNYIDYSPSIHSNWQKDFTKMLHQHLIFLNCQTRTLPNFHKRTCLTRDSAVTTLRKIRGLSLCWRLDMLDLMFKKIWEGNRRLEFAKIPYLLTMVLGDLF